MSFREVTRFVCIEETCGKEYKTWEEADACFYSHAASKVTSWLANATLSAEVVKELTGVMEKYKK